VPHYGTSTPHLHSLSVASSLLAFATAPLRTPAVSPEPPRPRPCALPHPERPQPPHPPVLSPHACRQPFLHAFLRSLLTFLHHRRGPDLHASRAFSATGFRLGRWDSAGTASTCTYKQHHAVADSTEHELCDMRRHARCGIRRAACNTFPSASNAWKTLCTHEDLNFSHGSFTCASPVARLKYSPPAPCFVVSTAHHATAGQTSWNTVPRSRAGNFVFDAWGTGHTCQLRVYLRCRRGPATPPTRGNTTQRARARTRTQMNTHRHTRRHTHTRTGTRTRTHTNTHDTLCAHSFANAKSCPFTRQTPTSTPSTLAVFGLPLVRALLAQTTTMGNGATSRGGQDGRFQVGLKLLTRTRLQLS
jgi:hypothetical protein